MCGVNYYYYLKKKRDNSYFIKQAEQSNNCFISFYFAIFLIHSFETHTTICVKN